MHYVRDVGSAIIGDPGFPGILNVLLQLSPSWRQGHAQEDRLQLSINAFEAKQKQYPLYLTKKLDLELGS